MKLTLTIPDELAESYEHMGERLNGNIGLSDIILAQLERFRGVHAADRIVVIDSKSRDKLEHIFSGAQLTGGEDLLSLVEALAKLEIGEIKVPFTTAQYKLMKTWAERAGRSTQEMVTQVIKDIKYELLNRVS